MDFIPTLARARGGDRDAAAALLGRYRSFLLFIANEEFPRELQARFGASDVVQEAILGAHRGLQEFRGHSEDEFRQWLAAILRNTLQKTARFHRTLRRGAEAACSLDGSGAPQPADPAHSPSSDVGRQEQIALMLGALQRLGDDHRRVIELRNLEQKPFREIGELMDRSEDAVQKLWCRAIRELRAAMGRSA